MVLWEQILTQWDLWSTLARGAYELTIAQTEIGAAVGMGVDLMYTYCISLLYLILYPIIWVIALIQNIILVVLEPLLNLLNAVVLAGASIYDVIYLFQGTFPTPWVVGLTATLSIVIGLRIYSLIPLIGRK